LFPTPSQVELGKENEKATIKKDVLHFRDCGNLPLKLSQSAGFVKTQCSFSTFICYYSTSPLHLEREFGNLYKIFPDIRAT